MSKDVKVTTHGFVKAKVRNPANGRTYLLLGITEENIKRMRAGEPIGLDLHALQMQNQVDNVFLIYGADVEDLHRQMKGMDFSSIGVTLPPPRKTN
jgi:hypothetical protein